MIKPRISGRVTRENLVDECFTKETIKLQLTYSVAFFSLMVNKFECPLGTRQKRSQKKEKSPLDRSRPLMEAVRNV